MPQNSLLSSPLFAHLFFLFLTKNDFSKIIYLNIFSNLLFVSKSSAALVNTIKSYLVKMCSLWHFKPPPTPFSRFKTSRLLYEYFRICYKRYLLCSQFKTKISSSVQILKRVGFGSKLPTTSRNAKWIFLNHFHDYLFFFLQS